VSELHDFQGYDEFLIEVKERIRTAQVRAALAVSREVDSALLADRAGNFATTGAVRLGRKGSESSCCDLKNRFPLVFAGFSRNQPALYGAPFAEAYPDPVIVQQLCWTIRRSPWGTSCSHSR